MLELGLISFEVVVEQLVVLVSGLIMRKFLLLLVIIKFLLLADF